MTLQFPSYPAIVWCFDWSVINYLVSLKKVWKFENLKQNGWVVCLSVEGLSTISGFFPFLFFFFFFEWWVGGWGAQNTQADLIIYDCFLFNNKLSDRFLSLRIGATRRANRKWQGLTGGSRWTLVGGGGGVCRVSPIPVRNLFSQF